MSTATDRRATYAMAAAAVGVYALVMSGATAAIADAVSVCSAWPTCGGRLVVPLDDPALAVAWVHRLVAVLVGGAVLVAAALGWRATARRRVRAALGAAVVLYPVQIGLGAAVAVYGRSPLLSGAHLLTGMGLFVGLLLALAWTLEREPTAGSGAAALDPDPDGDTAPSYEPPSTAAGRAAATLRAYLSLTKPRLMWLLCLVAAAGMGLAAGPSLTPRAAAATLAGGVLAIGASGTFNHVLERDVDRRMARTSGRPLATDRVGVRNAVAFGAALAAASVAVFASINLLAAALGAAAIAYYSVIYTLVLKPNTAWNTVIGGLAGSFPAVIGAAAATGAVGASSLLLAAVIFLWTPAHFYNLALAYEEDYARGGFPMLPVVRGERVTRKRVLFYLGATLLAASGLSAIGGLGPLYAATSVAFGAVFLWAAIGLHRDPGRAAALRSFHASNAYLGALLVAVVLDTLAI